MSNSPPFRIAIAGSTERTVVCAEALRLDSRYTIPWVLTPVPKRIGRKKVLTENPVHCWAQQHSIQSILVEHKIDESVKAAVEEATEIDFLLVVDFGYLIPNWLLSLPQQAPLNIHPSALPRWRGSSPGQFVILYGETESAVTLMTMDETLDSGDIISQLPFVVQNNWTQKDYYRFSFELMQRRLADLIATFAAGEVTATPQPDESPTPIARRLSRDDGFVPWDVILKLQQDPEPTEVQLGKLLADAQGSHPNSAAVVAAACRAFSPWPGISTIVSTQIGELRLKILSCHVAGHQLVLDQVQLEGKKPAPWEQVKSQII